MSFGEGGANDVGFETMHGRSWPSVTQYSVFLENRVGQLLEVVRRFEGSKVRIVALSITDSAECAFVRFLLSHPEAAERKAAIEQVMPPAVHKALLAPAEWTALKRICS